MEKNNLLIIEDDEGMQLYMNIIISKFLDSPQIKAAFDGAEALEILQNFSPDYIFLDLNMPGMDGFEFLEKYRDTYKNSDARIIVTTSSHNPNDVEKITELDLTHDYIIKPLNETHLESIFSKSR